MKIFFLRLMKSVPKRILFIHETSDGKCRKFWQRIDSRRMNTLEQVWNDLNQQLNIPKKEYRFYYYQSKQSLPIWYHVDLVEDNAQILIKDKIEQ